MTLSHSLQNRGLTLVELVVTVAIVTGLLIFVGKFQADVFSLNRTFSGSFSASDQAQKLLRPMTAEIRSASQSSNGAYLISAFATNDFSFYSDIDNNGGKDLVRYYLSGTTVYKEVTPPTGSPAVYNSANKKTTTFITGVQNQTVGVPIFRYYSSAHTGGSTGEIVPGTGKIEDIRLIRITFRIDADTNKPPAAVDVTTLVSIRNLKQQ